MLKFLSVSSLVLLSRFYDVFTTWLYIPDLTGESNPLVKWLGAGWNVVITVQVLLSLFVIWCYYFYTFRFRPALPEEEGVSRIGLASYLFFRDKNSIGKLFYRMPHDKSALIASTGYVGAWVLIIISLVVGTSTTFLINSDSYRSIYKNGIPYLFYGLMGILAVTLYYKFFNDIYRRYRTAYRQS